MVSVCHAESRSNCHKSSSRPVPLPAPPAISMMARCSYGTAQWSSRASEREAACRSHLSGAVMFVEASAGGSTASDQSSGAGGSSSVDGGINADDGDGRREDSSGETLAPSSRMRPRRATNEWPMEAMGAGPSVEIVDQRPMRRSCFQSSEEGAPLAVTPPAK